MIIGIDFGTTNSGAAIYTPQGPQMIETVEGVDTMPSVVAETSKGFIVGRPALRQMRENPQYTFRHIKRFLGREFNENEHGQFQLAEGPDGLVWWQGKKGLISGPQLVAEIIKAILVAAEYRLKKRPDGAVIAVPVDFHEPQLRAIREAARLAGLKPERVHLFEEPFAASLAFGLDRDKFSTVAVYDLGGGTFDITILNMDKDNIAPAGMNGVSFLGGVDFDKRLVDHCADRFFMAEGEDVREKPHNMPSLERAAEAAKIDLSSVPEATVYVQGIANNERGLASLKENITRTDFEAMTKDLVVRTIASVEDALKQAGLKAKEIDHVLLVGGQSRMPLIHKVLEEYFGPGKIVSGPKPEFAVALGAAIRAAEIEGRKKVNTVGRMATASVGLTRYGGAFVHVIRKGEALPAKATVELTTAEDGQGTLDLQVWQGEAPDAEDNTLVFSHAVEIEVLDAGEVTVPVTFEIDAGGRLTVMVSDELVYGLQEAA